MRPSIYFIGGASGSGKSWTAADLARTHARHLVELDQLNKTLKAAGLSGKELEEQSKKLAFHVVDMLASRGADCIVEGGWINPDGARQMQDRYGKGFRAVFCGFPGAIAEERYAMFKAAGASGAGARHWLVTDETEARALEFLREQISGSRWYRRTCEELGIPFVDFSDVAQGAERLKRDYENRQG